MTVFVSSLHIYPVKSFAATPTRRMSFDRVGPLNDRRFMLVDASGTFLSQRKLAGMAFIHANIASTGDLVLSDRRSEQRFLLPSECFSIDSQRAFHQKKYAKVWSDVIEVVDMGDELADWLSACLDQSVRLVFLGEESIRSVDPDYGLPTDLVSFADGFPILLLSRATINAVLDRNADETDIARFRANIIVDGCEAFEEDSWRQVRIGEVEFDVVKPCARCILPSINPETAVREPAIAALLKRFRQSDGQVYIGQNLIHRSLGEISVGDRLDLTVTQTVD